MAARKRNPNGSEDIRRRPATTPEGRENELVAAAIDLAEKQIRSGNASSQVITHFLKLGSTRERLEQQRLEHENELTRVRIEAQKPRSVLKNFTWKLFKQCGHIQETYQIRMSKIRTYSELARLDTFR